MNKLLIAAAGAGKTSHIFRDSLLSKDKRILITTYTKENKKEILSRYHRELGVLPGNITVQTWFSFLLKHMVRPYQSFLIKERITNICPVNERSGIIGLDKEGNPIYASENNAVQYYCDKEFRIYTDKISKFAYKINSITNGLLIERLSNIFDSIYIDEVQDLAGYDLDIVKLLAHSSLSLTMVGDPRQVAYLTHHEKRYSQYSDGKIQEFVAKECKKDVEIDTSSLRASFRNNQLICDFANRLFPECASVISASVLTDSHQGVFLVKERDVAEYIRRYKPVLLRNSATKEVPQGFPVYNFGESKGKTFERVLIYCSEPILNWLNNNNSNLRFYSRCKLYIAITRARHSVAFVIPDDYATDCDYLIPCTDLPLLWDANSC